MYNAQVLEVFIASPSDVCEERDTCEQILHEWNTIHSKRAGIVLQPRRWETSVYSEVGNHPQDSVNMQILESADLLIAIFWIRLGSQTLKYASGTVEEIKKHTANNKPAMLFFSDTPVKPTAIDREQYARLQEFKTWCIKNSLFEEYNSLQDFKEKLRNHVSLFANNKLQENPRANVNTQDNQDNSTAMYSQTKQDAVDFLCALRDKSDSVSPVETANTFLQDIGLFRASRLSPFLVHEKLLEIIPRTDG